MFVNQLVTLLDRESSILVDENHHSSAILLSEAVAKLRDMAEAMRAAGMDPDKRI